MLAGAALLLMIYPSQTARGVSDGIEVCLERVVPSIFPMMLVCMLAVESGYVQRLGCRLSAVSEVLFGLPGEAAAAVVLSMIGGYPAGAKTVVELYERGAVSREQAVRMTMFCFCAGPAFLVGVVGGLAGTAYAGWLLMAVQMVTVVIMGVFICRINGKKRIENKGVCASQSRSDISLIIVSSVRKTSSAMLQVCLYVMIFSAVNALLNAAGVSESVVRSLILLGADKHAAEAVIPVLMEVTGGCMHAVGAGLPVMAFAVGFGGLSVQLQVLAITSRLGVRPVRFFAARLAQGTISALLIAGVLALFPDTLTVSVSAALGEAQFSGSPQGAVMLVVMCAVCMLCLHEDIEVFRLRKKNG